VWTRTTLRRPERNSGRFRNVGFRYLRAANVSARRGDTSPRPETATTDRFVIEVSRVGTVDHIVDLEADRANRPSYPSRREFPGEKPRDRSTRSPASEYIDLPDYADWKAFDTTASEGDAPDEVCSYCWSEVVERVEQHASGDGDDRIGTVGHRLRWKQQGRAREERCDIVVRPETT